MRRRWAQRDATKLMSRRLKGTKAIPSRRDVRRTRQTCSPATPRRSSNRNGAHKHSLVTLVCVEHIPWYMPLHLCIIRLFCTASESLLARPNRAALHVVQSTEGSPDLFDDGDASQSVLANVAEQQVGGTTPDEEKGEPSKNPAPDNDLQRPENEHRCESLATPGGSESQLAMEVLVGPPYSENNNGGMYLAYSTVHARVY